MKRAPLPSLPTLTVDTVATSFETKGSTYGPFRVNRYGLAWVVNGGGITTLDDTAIETRAGTVLLLRPRMVLRHDWGAQRSFQSFIVFDVPRLSRSFPAPRTWPLSRHIDPDAFFFELWRYTLSSEHGVKGGSPVVRSAVALLLSMFLSGETEQRATTALSHSEMVERALDVMHRHAEADSPRALTLTELAKRAHATPQHLCRVFKRELGVSPMQALALLRLERAASMLERSSQTLAKIAEQLGYSSQFHFSRRFKQLYGVAPSRYREEFRRGLTTRPGGSMFRHHRLRRYAYEAAPGRMAKPVRKSRKKSAPSRRERGGG